MRREGPHQVARDFERVPAGSPSRAMDGNALCHLGVAWLGGCYIDPRRWQRPDQALGVAALARARAAENEREPGAARCSGGRQLLRAGNELPDKGRQPHSHDHRSDKPWGKF
jgi:hypothetical protein